MEKKDIYESIEGLDKFATPTDITRFTNNLIRKLYKVSQPYTSHRFRDNDWRHLKTFVEILRNVEGVEELIPAGTGPYKQSQEGAYKEYTLDITTILGSKIGGFIRCHFCGSQENPWDVYDMTVNFYRNNDNIMMNESKQGIQSKKLYDAVKEHGGFGEDWKNKMYVHGITDNDIIGIYSPEEYKKFLNGKLNYRDLISNAGITPVDKLDRIKTCSFKDGFKIIYILRNNNNIETTSKKVNRGKNAPYSSGKRPYMYSNKDRQNKVNKIKNNMAKVQINENELKQIVAESVKKVLNELDWRTYANAAKKSREKANQAGNKTVGNYNRAREAQFDIASRNAQTTNYDLKDYDLYDSDGRYYDKTQDCIKRIDREIERAQNNGLKVDMETGIVKNQDGHPITDLSRYCFGDWNIYLRYKNKSYSRINKKTISNIEKRDNDMLSFALGAQKYQPGKGWTDVE